MNMVLQTGTPDRKKEIVKDLMEVDKTRAVYYDYLLENEL